MRSLLTAVLASVAFASSAAAQGDRLAGPWNGALTTPGGRLRLVFNLEKQADGTLGGSMTSVDQGGVRIPVKVLPQGDTAVRIETVGLPAAFQGRVSANRDTLAGAWEQGGARLPLTLTRGAGNTAVAARPQDPKPPFPYRAEDVSFASVPGVRIAGTLTVPQGNGPFPAAVLITGSGPQDRDETLMNHRPFAVLADYLTRRGIAVLRMDDRGVGGSTGSFAASTSADFAQDVAAAVRFLGTRGEIARGKVGLIGHSEGGLIAPMVAARPNSGVAYVVMLAGPGIPGDSILKLQSALIMRASGAPEAAITQAGERQARIFSVIRSGADSATITRRLREMLTPQERAAAASQPDSLPAEYRQAISPWFRAFIAYDPRATLRRLTVPTLALNGSLDLQVPPKENLAAIDAALRAAGNRDYRVMELLGLNHLFQTARTGSPAEYAQIDETFAAAALDAVASWISQRFVRTR